MQIKTNRKSLSVINFDMDSEMNPGLYNISNEAYHASEGLSNSGITKILECPKKYWFEYLNKPKDANEYSSRALVIGQAVHTASLEPTEFEKRYCESPNIDRRTNVGKAEYKEFQEANAGKIVLTLDEMTQVKGMAESIRQNAVFSKLIVDPTRYIEHSIYFTDTEYDVLLKSKPDFFNHFLALDLKTTISAHPKDFEKAIFNFGYHRQAAIALDALTALTGCQYDSFVILAVEKEEPYLTASYMLEKDAIDLGRREYKGAVKTFKECKEREVWPSYPQEVIKISLPQWAFNQQVIA